MSSRKITYLSNACVITCVCQNNIAETLLDAAKIAVLRAPRSIMPAVQACVSALVCWA